MPHDQNTGGFYVCVLQKASSGSASSTNAADADAEADVGASTSAGVKRALSPSAEDRDVAAKKEKLAEAADESAPASGTATPIPTAATTAAEGAEGKKRKQDWSYREDPFAYAPETDPELMSIVKYFKLKETFPRDTILVRNEEGKVVPEA